MQGPQLQWTDWQMWWLCRLLAEKRKWIVCELMPEWKIIRPRKKKEMRGHLRHFWWKRITIQVILVSSNWPDGRELEKWIIMRQCKQCQDPVLDEKHSAARSPPHRIRHFWESRVKWIHENSHVRIGRNLPQNNERENSWPHWLSRQPMQKELKGLLWGIEEKHRLLRDQRRLWPG